MLCSAIFKSLDNLADRILLLKYKATNSKKSAFHSVTLHREGSLTVRYKSRHYFQLHMAFAGAIGVVNCFNSKRILWPAYNLPSTPRLTFTMSSSCRQLSPGRCAVGSLTSCAWWSISKQRTPLPQSKAKKTPKAMLPLSPFQYSARRLLNVAAFRRKKRESCTVDKADISIKTSKCCFHCTLI